jgi:hypothetical protein
MSTTRRTAASVAEKPTATPQCRVGATLQQKHIDHKKYMGVKLTEYSIKHFGINFSSRCPEVKA